MLLKGALATFRKGSRGHLLNLINPLSVRKVLRNPKIFVMASPKPNRADFGGNEASGKDIQRVKSLE